MNIYAVYDVEAESYSQPYFCTNDKIATRQFVLSLDKVPDVVIGSLELRFVASYDEQSLKFEDYKKRCVFKGLDLDAWKKEHTKEEVKE